MYIKAFMTNVGFGYADNDNVLLFEINEALKFMEEFNAIHEAKIYYSDVKDSFWQAKAGAEEFSIWKGRNYETAEGIKHLYDIGRK